MSSQTIGYLVIFGIILGVIAWKVAYKFKPRKAVAKGILDTVLLDWTVNDPFRVRDLLNGGVVIFGRTGSGKTSSSGWQLGQAIAGCKSSGGLILAAKPGEDRRLWERIFEAAGRKDDLIIFGPGSDRRCNFLEYLSKSGGQVRDVVRFLTTMAETLRTSDTKGGESSDFFEREQDRCMSHVVTIVKAATGEVSGPALQSFLAGAAMNPQQLSDESWRAGFHNSCLKVAYEKDKTPMEAHDVAMAMEYFLGEWPNMADRQRSGILTGVMGLFFVLNSGMTRELVSTTTNVTPDDTLNGKFILVDMCVSEFGDAAALVASGFKHLTQLRLLRREVTETDPFHVIWVDESPQMTTAFDSHYLAQCRSHRGCMVYLTQSLASYYAKLSGHKGKNQVDALLANFGAAKIFHALGDEPTATFAANLIGRSLQTFVGTSAPPVENLYEEFMGPGKLTTSTSTQYEHVLQANVFMNGLRTGGEGAGFICDAIVVRSGEPFADGNNYLWCAFSQK